MMKSCVLLSAALLLSCDDREVLHAPSPTFARMMAQRRVDPFEAPMRTPPEGVVPRDDAEDDAPPPPRRELLELGRVRFETVCATCHGVSGHGVSVVAWRMEHRRPPSLHEPRLRAATRERLFDVATRGYGLMPGQADVLSWRERWAVASYVKALQLSQHVHVADLGPDLRERLEREVP